MEPTESLFVYGTLKSRKRHHHLISHCQKLEPRESWLEGLTLWNTDLGYPVALPGKGKVRGETYLVSKQMLEILDRTEGHPTIFRREKVNNVWVYLYNDEVSPKMTPIKDGIWEE